MQLKIYINVKSNIFYKFSLLYSSTISFKRSSVINSLTPLEYIYSLGQYSFPYLSWRTEYRLEDHVFLFLDNNIFDPTYRQFMIDKRNPNKLCEYKHFLFNQIPPFLVNEKEKIVHQLNNLLKVNRKVYGKPFIELNELMEYWEFQEDVTENFNLHEYIDNKNLLHDKPEYYKWLVDFLTNQRQ